MIWDIWLRRTLEITVGVDAVCCGYVGRWMITSPGAHAGKSLTGFRISENGQQLTSTSLVLVVGSYKGTQ